MDSPASNSPATHRWSGWVPLDAVAIGRDEPWHGAEHRPAVVEQVLFDLGSQLSLPGRQLVEANVVIGPGLDRGIVGCWSVYVVGRLGSWGQVWIIRTDNGIHPVGPSTRNRASTEAVTSMSCGTSSMSDR